MSHFKKHRGAGGEYFGTGSVEDKKLWNRLKNSIAHENDAFEDTKGKTSPNFSNDLREKHKKGGKVGKAQGGQIMMGTTPDSRPPLKKGGECK